MAQPPDAMPLDFGEEFLATYEVRRVLGQGAFGVVLDARQRSLDRPVAIKYLLAKRSGDEDVRHRFRREARILSLLVHPNVVQIFDFGWDGEIPYLVEELLRGTTLDVLLKERETLTPEEAVAVARPIASALAAAHEVGAIHRDLKPPNVFLEDGGAVKLLDFGLAKELGRETRVTRTGAMVGTPAYAAPEQILGEPSSVSGDLYGLGTMLFQMLCGRFPFELKIDVMLRDKPAMSPPSVATMAKAPLSPGLVALVDRLIALRPADRPSSAQEVERALAQTEEGRRRARPRLRASPAAPEGAAAPAVAHQAVQAVVTAKESPAAASPPRRRGPGAALVATAVAVVAVAYVLLVRAGAFSGGPSEPRPPTDAGGVVSAPTLVVEDERVRVAWASTRPTKGSVAVWPAGLPTALREVVEDRALTAHDVVVEGLAPSSEYELELRHGGVAAAPRRRFATRQPAALSTLEAVDVGYLEADLAVAATGPCTVELEVTVPGERSARRVSLPGRGPRWTWRVAGLPEQASVRVVASARGSARALSTREATFKTLATERRILLGGFQTSLGGRSGMNEISNLWGAKPVRAAPELWGGRLFVNVDRAGLYAIDTANGERVWHDAKAPFAVALRVVGDKLYLQEGASLVRCRSCADGREVFVRTLPGRAAEGLVVGAAGLLLWMEELGPLCLDASTGATRFEIRNAMLRPPWSAPGLTVWSFSELFNLWAYDSGTGARKDAWSDQVAATLTVPPLAADGQLFLGLDDGTVLGGPGGRLRRVRAHLGGGVASLAFGDGRLYALRSAPHGLRALEPASGRTLWDVALNKPVATGLLSLHGNVYYGTDNDYVECRDGATGAVLWSKWCSVKPSFGLIAHPDGVIYCSGLADVMLMQDQRRPKPAPR